MRQEGRRVKQNDKDKPPVKPFDYAQDKPFDLLRINRGLNKRRGTLLDRSWRTGNNATAIIQRGVRERPGLGGLKQMPIQQWSDQIVVVELGNDPQFTDELNSLNEQLEGDPAVDVVLNMQAVSFVNSSNIAKLLRVRKAVLAKDRRVFLTGISTQVWGILLVTGLDKIFDVADNTASALTSLQMKSQ